MISDQIDSVIADYISKNNTEHIRIEVTPDIYSRLDADHQIMHHKYYESHYKGHTITVSDDIAENHIRICSKNGSTDYSLQEVP